MNEAWHLETLHDTISAVCVSCTQVLYCSICQGDVAKAHHALATRNWILYNMDLQNLTTLRMSGTDLC